MSQTIYKIYYSSRSKLNGNMWCPDCTAVEPTLKQVFNQPNGPSAEIIYVGQRPEWKDPNCVYRQEPLKVTGVPTVLKFVDGNIVGRIEDADILNKEKMSAFMKS